MAGLGSRRAVENLVREGHIAINGCLIRALGTQVSSGDIVTYRGKRIFPQRHIYAVLHKPKGYVCSASPKDGEKTIYQLLPSDWPRVFYVGRLDKESEGLLLLTNDGAWAQRLAHPRYKLRKIYHVTLDRFFDSRDAAKLKKGMLLKEGKARIDRLSMISRQQLCVTLTQGLKRQIREMFYRVGYEVKRLVRVQYGCIQLKGLPVGRARLLTAREVSSLISMSASKSLDPRAQEGNTNSE
jgi:23S rRNA pseudouridine2605 synthase